jgi:heterodisulfide reductase subunit B
MSELFFFLGCITPNRYPGIEIATKKTLEQLGVTLLSLDGASCCPAPGVFRSFDKLTWLVIAARNLCLAEEKERDLLTVCNGCFGSLSDANNLLKEDKKLRRQVNRHLAKIGKKFNGTITVRHVAEYLYQDIGVEKIDQVATKKLTNIKAAVHYGCHLIKPTKERHLGSAEKPKFLDELVEATGASSVEYDDKLSCCGAGGGVRTAALEKALTLSEHKLKRIKEAGADCIVNACPFCHLQLDVGQTEIAKKFERSYNIPVLHYTQLLGVAMGFTPEELGIDMNVIKDEKFMNKLRGENR